MTFIPYCGLLCCGVYLSISGVAKVSHCYKRTHSRDTIRLAFNVNSLEIEVSEVQDSIMTVIRIWFHSMHQLPVERAMV